MARRRIATLAALALAFVQLAVGCGGNDDGNEFAEHYNAAVKELSSVNSDIGEATGKSAPKSNAAIAKELGGIAAAMRRTRSNLSDLDPPEQAEDQFETLLTSMEDGVDDLRAAGKAARRNDPQGYNKQIDALSRTLQDITAAEDALKKAVDG